MVYNLGANDHPLGEISLKVNDNAYHVVKFHRTGFNSTLQIDDYNVQTSHPSGPQLQVFNSQSQIQIGGKWSKGKSRIERPFSGIMSGVVVNGLRILDLAAEKDIHASIRGDVQLISGILDRHDPMQKMQQVYFQLSSNIKYNCKVYCRLQHLVFQGLMMILSLAAPDLAVMETMKMNAHHFQKQVQVMMT